MTTEQLERKRVLVRAWQDKNREKIRSDMRASYAANPELFKARAKAWRTHYKTQGPAKIKTEKRCSRCETVKPISDFNKNASDPSGHSNSCKPCSVIAAREWRINNPERFKASTSARNSIRWRTDAQYKLTTYLRTRLTILLKGNKSDTTETLTGCTFQELRRYIELQWKPGMSWSNWGRTNDCWQIDHKRPVSSFDLTDPAQQIQCFHYSNLEPLWAVDNRRKSDTYAS